MPDGEVYECAGRYFVVHKPALRDGKQPREIQFRPQGEAVPADVAALQIDIDRAVSTLDILFPSKGRDATENERKFRLYYDRLFNIACASIGQDHLELGPLSLAAFKSDVAASEAPRIKNAYLIRLGMWALSFALVAMVIFALARNGFPYLPFWVPSHGNFLVLAAGSCVGAWLSFSIRNPEFGFKDLSLIEHDMLNPPIRLLFVMGLAAVVGLLFALKVVVLTLGQFTTDLETSAIKALLIGLFCGIGELTLATTVGSRATDFLAAVGRAGAAIPPGGGNGPQPIRNGAGDDDPAVAERKGREGKDEQADSNAAKRLQQGPAGSGPDGQVTAKPDEKTAEPAEARDR